MIPPRGSAVTAIAVMQLWEQGVIDLDAPAGDYLRAYRLTPARPGHRAATVRLAHVIGAPGAGAVVAVRD
ncbi:serine hydrolase [Nonomuraea basaltis]|uniref:serine hydrolase n=1 Tax=Nonomuraea basaltis TaxID=2495887 RepID=UPI00197DFEAB|nr:serine hydrolase [Nonomuraea basaltis]